MRHELSAEDLVQHLVDIGDGRCRISDDEIEASGDTQTQEILTGLLFLHQELELGRRRQADAERALYRANEELEAQVAARTAALQRVQEQLVQSQKMEAVGRLAGGIAHDFNNLLSVVLSYASLLLDALPEPNPLRDDVLEIKAAGDRCSQLTRQLLAFSRRQLLQPRVLDVNEIVRGMDRLLRRTIGADVTLEFRPADSLGCVNADANQLEQVILNLAVNARDAMPAGGTLTLETQEITLFEPLGEVEPGDWVVVSVADDGCGMDAATSARVFEPFFTTKEVGKGTGLGLATVFGIVRQSGGHVLVDSELGRGTVFHVYLPLSEGAAIERAEGPASGAIPSVARGTETVLVVEDQDQVRLVVVGILRKAGYRVLEAPNGGEALLICEKHAAPIDILVTDVILPHMNGAELVERVRGLRSGMKVLFMSGYTGDALAQQGILPPDIDLISKPFTPAALTRRVRAILDGGGRVRLAC